MKKLLITTFLLLSSTSTAFATLTGVATLEGEYTAVGKTVGGYIDYFIPLNDVDGVYGTVYDPSRLTQGTQGFGTTGDCFDTNCGQISGGTLDMFLHFYIPTGQTGTTLKLDFDDLDLKTDNDPNGFFEKLILDGPLPSGTFDSYNDLHNLDDVAVTKWGDPSSIEFSNLSIASGDFWLKLGFQAYSEGLSNRKWCNTSEQLKATLTTAPVPEPTTMLLFGTGLVGLAGAYRRKKK